MSSTTVSTSGSPASIKNELINELSPKAVPMSTQTAAKTGKAKNRKRVNSAEKRSQHNAIERQRRETLNGKFISLARLLPALANVRRPSKSAIVNGSIAHLNYQRSQRLLAAKLLRQVSMQHDQLLEEVNHWRSRAGVAPKDGTTSWTSEMDDICAVEKETFGVFANEDGDADVEDGDDEVANETLDASIAASLSSLLNTRPSNDMEMANSILMAQAAAASAQTNMMHSDNSAFNWTGDFNFGSVSSSTSSLPFNAFMSDSVDTSSTGSPANSIQGSVLTPPEMGMYSHSSSPRSLNDEITGLIQPKSWQEQQLMFLQSMQAPVRQQSMPALGMNFGQSNLVNNNNSNMFSLFAQSQMPTAQNLLAAAASSGSDAFTRSILAQMFPSQGVVPEDSVAQWRKLAAAGLNQTMESIPSARTVRPDALRSNSMWERPIEGF